MALVVCAPGLVIGAVVGAVLWAAHRLRGGLVGAASGAVLCLGAESLWNLFK